MVLEGSDREATIRLPRMIMVFLCVATVLLLSHAARACEIAVPLTPDEIAREAERARKNGIVEHILSWMIFASPAVFMSAIVAAVAKKKRLAWTLAVAAALLAILDVLLVQSINRCGGGPL